MESALVPGGEGGKPKEGLLKMAARDNGGAANKKPPWWSTREYGLPMDYEQREPRPVVSGGPILTAEGNPVNMRRAPGIADLTLIKKRESALLVQEKQVPPSRLVELEEKLRGEVGRHTPYHERKTTVLIRAFQTFDHERRGTLPLDAFRRCLECFGVTMTPAEGRALFRKFGQDAQKRLPYQVFTRALFTSKSRLLAWTKTHYMNARSTKGLPRGTPFVLEATKETLAADRMFDAKIQPLSAGPGHSVTGSYPPSRWATDTWEKEGQVHPIVRARQPPDVELELEHVYGYNGCCEYGVLAGKQYLEPIPSVLTSNLFYTSTKEVVYATAAVGIVLNWSETPDGKLDEVNQRFFTGHTKGVLAVAVDESRNYCATGQGPIAKTKEGQDVDPFVSIWCVHSMQELMRLSHRSKARQNLDPMKPPKKAQPGEPDEGCMGIQAICFSEDGQRLITACRNPATTIFVWEWRFAKLLYRADTKSGVPPQCYGVMWNPVEIGDDGKHFDFVTFGNKFINFWKEDAQPSDPDYPQSWTKEAGSFIDQTNPNKDIIVQDVFCCAFLDNGNVVTGMSDGNIYLWEPQEKTPDPSKPMKYSAKKRLLVDAPIPTEPKTRAHVHTVQVLKIRYVREGGGDPKATLLSGGGGGTIKVWEDLDGVVPLYKATIELPRDLGQRKSAPPAAGNGASQPPAVKSLDCFPGSEDLIVGTDKCDIWKLKLKPDNSTDVMQLVKGNAADVNGIAAHPTKEHIFASASESDKIYIWSADQKSMVGKPASLKGRAASCCEFRGDGKHLAVGSTDGCIFVFKENNDWEGEKLVLSRVDEMAIWPLRDCTSAIQDLRYSPDLRTLAAASREQTIDLYDCAASTYVRLARCTGHSATVLHIDWSADSKMLQSQCNAYELLYWNCDRGDPEPEWTIGQPSPLRGRKRELYGRQILDDQRDQQWDSWTSCFGFDVMGIWPPDYINPDINMVARSPTLERDGSNQRQLVAVADNHSGVMVLNYPAVVNKQPCHYHLGHSSFVTNVRWLKYKNEKGLEELKLISAGGHDRSLMQWRVKRLEPPDETDEAFQVGGKFRGGLFQDAKFAWYKKYTGQEWDGMEPTYKKAINVVKANEVLAPARIAAEERRRLRGDAEAMFKVVSKGAARIPLDSMKAYLTENKVVEENQIEKLVAEINTNSDREIDLDEFCNGWHKMQKGAGSSSSSGGGGALKSSGGGGALKSDSALLQDTIAKQEAALKEQQKKIEELQAKLKAKG